MKKLTKPVRKIPTFKENPGFRTLAEMVEASAKRHAKNLCYLIPRNDTIYELTYEEVLEYITKVASHLKGLGLGKGDHIAVLGENKPEWAISFFAVSWIGAVAVPLDARSNIYNHKFILSFSSAKAIIASDNFLESIDSVATDIKELKHIIPMDNIEEICSHYTSGAVMEKIDPHDLLEIIFTSGSTGDPKGVMLSHLNVMSNVSDIYSIMNYSEKDRAFSILPIHHSYECVGGLISPFSYGISVFYARSLRPRELLEDLKAAKPTIWLNAPTILEKLYTRIENELSGRRGIKKFLTAALPDRVLGSFIKRNLGLEHAKLITSSGAPLPERVSAGLRQYGFNIIQAYGLTEASPLITANPVSRPKQNSIGMVIPSVEVEIRDIDGEGNGEICARGPNIMKGYYKNEAATLETITKDGWLLTGDIGYFDEDGYLYITGRKKFVIVTKGGKNIHPEELEEKLTASALIAEALAFSPDDSAIQALLYPDEDEVTKVFNKSKGSHFTPEETWELLNKEVREINRTLEAYKRIRHFALRLEEFPKTTTNKIKRLEFKDLNLTPETKIV
jgi:long-chain acyl-CoA synthetase